MPASGLSRSAIVLAGGASRRMGTAKEWLDAGGVPLLSRVIASVSEACSVVVVCPRSGQALPPLPVGVRRVDDPPGLAGGGPLVGVATGLAALGDEGLVFCGSVDAPLVTTGHATYVLDLLEARPEAQAVVPVSEDGRLHPLAGAVRLPAARAAAVRLVAAGERRLMALFEALSLARLPARDLPSPDVLLPCNSPEDWRRLRRLRGWL